MMKRIAKETAIHGIKEAWYANRIGRMFYAVVFATGSVLMCFQLSGLFQDYLSGNIGTKLTHPSMVDDVDVPSFYYCNEMWYPNLPGLKEIIHNQSMPKNLSRQMFDLRELYRNDTEQPLDKQWRLMRMMDLINGILIPRETGRFDRSNHDILRPEARFSSNFYARAHIEMIKMLEGIIGSSLRKTVESKLGESMTHENLKDGDLINQTHGIFPNEFEINDEVFSSSNSLYERIQLADRTGYPALSLDGICWQFHTGLLTKTTAQKTGLKHRHVVSHIGGFGRQLARLVFLYFTTPGSIIIQKDDSVTSVIDRIISEVQEYAGFYLALYSNHLSIAAKDEPHLLFHQKIYINMHSPGILIRYWTKRSLLKARKGWPCRSGNWTELDQAHCNQRRAREIGGLLCDQYLPASKHFQETVVSNETCIYDHTGLFEDGKSAADKHSIGPGAGFPLQVSSASRQQVLRNLTANTVHCPRPCSTTLYQFEATYPTYQLAQRRVECWAALAYMFVPQEEMHGVWWDRLRSYNQHELKSYIFSRALLRIRKRPYDTIMFDKWPCSVVNFERSEMHGQISEEYFLYSLPDLAAHVGGTVGLWIGASVISIVQLIYLCFLKRFFRQLQRNMLGRPTWCVVHQRRGGVTEMRERKKSPSHVKPPLRGPAVSLDHAHLPV